jgi:hypothetical protein
MRVADVKTARYSNGECTAPDRDSIPEADPLVEL